MGEIIFEFLGDTLLFIAVISPYAGMVLLGYAWGADNEIEHKKEYAKQYANKRVIEELEDITTVNPKYMLRFIHNRIEELKQDD